MNRYVPILLHPESEGGSSSLPGIDVANGLFVMGGNAALFARMLKKFADSPLYNELKVAISSGDAVVIQTAAHALKGVAANLSLHPLYEMTSAIDAEAKTGVAISPNDPRLIELERVYRETLASAQSVSENPDLLAAK